MAEQVQDPTTISLDEYIKKMPGAFQDTKRKKQRTAHPSQQWRLGRNGPLGRDGPSGRNGPGTLKRLGRYGPLRAVLYHHRGAQASRDFDGPPGLVLKQSFYQRPSVFMRLGWNPVINLARMKARRARQHFWRRPRGNMMYPWRPNYIRQNPWAQLQRRSRRPYYLPWPYNFQRPYNVQRPRWPKDGFPTQSARNCNEQDVSKLIQAQREKNRQMKALRDLQRSTANRGLRRTTQPQMCDQPLPQRTIPDASSGTTQYHIARDDYLPASNIRPPSPVFSVVSGTSRRSHANVNPFERPSSQPPARDPFAGFSTEGNTTMQTNRSITSAFRPTPTTTSIPFNQRFSNSRVGIFPMVAE